jgi:arylsulfatase A-like enzyme
VIKEWIEKFKDSSIKDAEALRSQFHHVIDIAPTIYEAAGITFPDSVNRVHHRRIAKEELLDVFRSARMIFEWLPKAADPQT